jgi:hypothetical protein
MSKKILFLDNDGVICLSNNWGGRFKKKGFDSNPQTPMDIRMDDFDTKAVKVLNEIIKETGCDIVMSSDWKRHGTLEQIQEMYEIRGIKKPIDLTPLFTDLAAKQLLPKDFVLPYFDRIEIERHLEILHWLKEHPEVTHWVAVDDLDMKIQDGWGLTNFVHCQRPYNEGIKQSGIKDKIIKFLNS